MLLGEPGRTGYDINFSVLGFPIRVHPAFFIMPLIICGGLLRTADNPGIVLLIATAVFFLSILIHELGHSLAFKFYGISSHIVLYWMGGVAVPGGATYGRRRMDSNGQIVVSLAGPFANFALAALLVGTVFLMGGKVSYQLMGFFPMVIASFNDTMFAGNESIFYFFYLGFFANIVWGVFNLIPVYPLDGGHVAREIFMQADPRNGLKNSLILSIIAAGLIAVIGLQTGSMFMAIFFGFMAYSSYQMLQHGNRFGGGW